MVQIKLSQEKAIEIYREKVSYDTRKRATYCPLFALHLVMGLVEKSIDNFAELKVSEVRQLSRKVRASIADFRKSYKDTLLQYGFDAYNGMLIEVERFNKAIVDDLFIHQQTYLRLFLNLNKTEYDISTAMATLFLAKEFAIVVKEFSDDIQKEINSQLNEGVTRLEDRRTLFFDDADSDVADYFIKVVEMFAYALKFPKVIEHNQDLRNAKAILKKDLNAIHFVESCQEN